MLVATRGSRHETPPHLPDAKGQHVPSVKRSVTVGKPIETVWTYVSDFCTSQEWDPPSVTTTRTSGEGGVGTTYHNVSKFLGKETEVSYESTEYVEGELLQLKGDAGSIQLLDTLTFSSTDGGTSVTYRADFDPTPAQSTTR